MTFELWDSGDSQDEAEARLTAAEKEQAQKLGALYDQDSEPSEEEDDDEDKVLYTQIGKGQLKIDEIIKNLLLQEREADAQWQVWKSIYCLDDTQQQLNDSGAGA